MTSTRSLVPISGAALISLGGLAIAATVVVDHMVNPWAFFAIQGCGFFLLFVGSGLSFRWFSRPRTWILLVVGSSGWFICWSWPFAFGLLIPLPLPFWAALSSIAYLVGTFFAVESRKASQWTALSVLTIGSFATTIVMATDRIYASDWTYVPVGLGAAAAGIMLSVGSLRHSSQPDTSDHSDDYREN
ncbi:hypothetical protein [Microbacterium sp. NPDC087591]|uniref:hypothetical protein n=1 Tax=Microbacterium sp. NPDC087591 TaxID=3364192 RepID=UPI00382571A0